MGRFRGHTHRTAGTVDCPQETLRSSVGLGIIASKEYTRQYMQHRICNHITELLVASNRVCILASTLGLCILYIVCMTMHNSSCTLVPQYYSSTLVVLCIEYAYEHSGTLLIILASSSIFYTSSYYSLVLLEYERRSFII